MLEIHRMAGHLIRRLHQISVSIFAERMKQAGLDLTPVQFGALSAIAAGPDTDQATLAGMIAYDRATIGGVVDRLEAKGLVSRTTSKRDRRARLLRLTPAGARMLRLAEPVVRALQDDVLSGLSSDERAQMLALLQKATDAGNAHSRAPLRIS